MSDVRVEVDVSAVRAALLRFSVSLDAPDLTSGASRTLAGAARSAAPRRSGVLAASVRATGAGVAFGGPGIPWAGPIHFGWRAHGITRNPFVYKAAERSADHMASDVGTNVGQAARRSGLGFK